MYAYIEINLYFLYQWQETLVSSIVIVGKANKRSNNWKKKQNRRQLWLHFCRRICTRGQAVQISGKPSKSQYLGRKPKNFKELVAYTAYQSLDRWGKYIYIQNLCIKCMQMQLHRGFKASRGDITRTSTLPCMTHSNPFEDNCQRMHRSQPKKAKAQHTV